MQHREHEIGIVQTQYAPVVERLVLESGETLGSVTIAYETYGELNEDRSNAVLICMPFPAMRMWRAIMRATTSLVGGMIWWGRAGPLIRINILSSVQMFWGAAGARQGPAR